MCSKFADVTARERYRGSSAKKLMRIVTPDSLEHPVAPAQARCQSGSGSNSIAVTAEPRICRMTSALQAGRCSAHSAVRQWSGDRITSVRAASYHAWIARPFAALTSPFTIRSGSATRHLRYPCVHLSRVSKESLPSEGRPQHVAAMKSFHANEPIERAR